MSTIYTNNITSDLSQPYVNAPCSDIHKYYMNPTPPAPTPQYTQTQAYHGIKRSAPQQDEVESSTNISNHFKKLRLTKTQVPPLSSISPVGVSLRSTDPTFSQQTHTQQHPESQEQLHNLVHNSNHDFSNVQNTNAFTRNGPPDDIEAMSLDPNPHSHKVYIPSLAQEIAEIEREESLERSQLLPSDIDKKVSKIPEYLLRDHNKKDNQLRGALHPPEPTMALVLYKDPTSISVPEEEDAVRKAIIEARRGAREKIRREYGRPQSTPDDVVVHRTTNEHSGMDNIGHVPHEEHNMTYKSAHDVRHGDWDEDMVEEDNDDPDAMDIE